MAEQPVNPPRIFVLSVGTAHLLLGILTLICVVYIWPERTDLEIKQPVPGDPPVAAAAARNVATTEQSTDWRDSLSYGQRAMVVVMLMGLAGGLVQSANSFIVYRGNRMLYLHWSWYYKLRPFIAPALALGFYMVVRGGLVSVNAANNGAKADEMINLYGVSAISFLVGVNSNLAMHKLFDIFNALFPTTEGEQNQDSFRGGNSSAAAGPVLETLEPASMAIGAAGKVTLKGGGFVDGATVLVNGESRKADFVSATELTVDITADDTALGHPIRLAAVSAGPEKRVSETKELTIE